MSLDLIVYIICYIYVLHSLTKFFSVPLTVNRKINNNIFVNIQYFTEH